ncbi:MAG: biopolymer transporter ExbD [Lentisphaeria bacterium]
MNFRKQIMPSQSSFQMAPMVDIMFILLIFFMASAVYAQWETRVDITVPTAESGERTTRQTGEIIINVDEKGRYFINNSKVDTPRLRSVLTQVSKQFPNQSIIIRADAETPHKFVIELLDICRNVDIWNIAFATLANKDK